MPVLADPALRPTDAGISPDAVQAQAEYWHETLSGAPVLLELPTDRPRPSRQGFAGASLYVELDEALTAALKVLSQRHGATLSVTLLAGWAVVLSRLSGQADVVIGTPSSGRVGGEIEGPAGFVANPLALRVDLSGAPTVAELLGRVKKRALGAQQNQDVPFDQVVELLQPARSLSHTPLFQVTFAWGNTGDGLAGDVESVDPAQIQATFDLSLALGERDGRIVGNVTYATALFERATVARWVGYLRAALRAMAADDTQSVDRLELLSEDERRRVVVEWNRTEADYPRELCIHELFEAQAARTPDAVAIVHESERVTYAELNARANRLAHHLRALGVGPDARVAICVDRGVEMMVGLLATMKAGGTYVPLDPAYPAERLEYMLADSAPVVLLTQGSLAGLFDGTDARVIDLGADAGTWAGEPETNLGRLAIGLTPDHLAYVIYTSGSTGQPKGVMVEHRSLANLVAWHCAAFGVKAGDRSSSVAGLGFDATTWEVWPPLCAGATLLLPATRDPQALLEWWEEQTLDVSFLPTPLAEVAFARGRASAGLRTLLIGGDRLRSIPAEPLPFALVNNYGPTETTVVATSGEIGASARVHIGRPIANTQVYLLDRAGQPVPMGVAGELYIGGAGVARGYQHRPGLTAERFVPDPFSPVPGARLYRTGDLARWLADSTLEFLGRTDFQVKIRGFRIELGEIEARLAEHPAVRDAVVLARPDGSGDPRLVAYYVGEALDVETLRAHLSERLPEYMVPAAYVWMEAYPLTPNGKVDRKALPAPDGDAFLARAYEAPVGEMEQALAAIWCELLGAERVGRRDNLFELGGHSLLAVRVVSRVREALGVEVSSRDVFDRPVLADFARGLQTAARAEAAAIERVDRNAAIPPSFAQQRLWFLEQLGNLGSTYHIPMRLRLRGELDGEALRRALDRIVARHEALRTRFPTADGEPVQQVAPVEESGFRLVEHDFRAASADQEEALRRLVRDESSAPFDLAHGPLIRGRLVRMAADDHVLLVTMHHIVSDGWSMGVLHRELGALYAAFARGQTDPLAPLPVQYADYAVWQRRWLDSDVLQAQADYWRETLAGAPELLELPADHPRPARQDFAGTSLHIELDEALTAALKTLSQRHGTTLYMTVLAGWATVLGRLSGQDDVVVGTSSSGRVSGDVEGLIGFFVNTLPVRVDLSGAPTVAELLRRVRERALEAQRHQDIPFEQVVERVRPARSLSHTPLFQAMLSWQEMPGAELALPGIAAAPLDGVEEGAAPFDLTLSIAPRGGRIAGTLAYATALFDKATAERHAGYLRRVLEEMAADDAKPAARLELLDAAERHRVLEEWNATDAGYPAGACVHDLLRAQAARTPEAVALSWRGERLTYAQLEARANQLANALRRRGVGPEVRVGICLPRTPELVAAMLGVLKAGGAYVPLDPAYPAERLGYMMEDAQVALVITDSQLADRLPPDAAALLMLDAEHDALAAESVDAPASGASPENLSHVIFTSGSTGRPKGVMIRHSSTVVLLHWLRENVTDEERSSVLFSTSINFDVSIAEVFGTLAWGGKLVIAENALELATLGEDVVYASMVPSAAAELLVSGGIPSCVKTLNLGGEALPVALAQGLYALGTVEKVGNLYGPTEDTTYSTYHLVPRGAEQVLVGAPVSNTQAYVLDDHLQPVPTGAVGELYLAGDGLSRGYASRPAMTAERFVPCPFGTPGSRMYRVMDRVRWREGEAVDSVPADSRTDALTHSRTAVLEYLGRMDFQVKVRGYRIELGEIEARLAEHPGLRAPVVLVREDAPGDRRLVAYYLADEPVAVDALKSHLATRLPGYMVPAAYVWMQAYPQTPNGKIDRKAFPAPADDAYAAREYEAPLGETEQAVAAIWAEALGTGRVGRGDDFFELGGHSLVAVRVASRVRQALGVEARPGDLFERPLLADFARGVQTAARAEATAIAPVDRTGAIPPSIAQQGLWLLERLGDTGAAYHIPLRMRLRGALDRGALVRALDRIVARHEALRTTFPVVDGEPVQRLAPAEESAFRLVEHDLHAAPDAENALRRLAADEANAPFDRQHGPLIRGRLVRMAADDHVLLLTMHHIVSDGWSTGVLRRELGALYAAFARGDADPLAPLPVQYADYEAWHRRWVGGHAVQAQAEYWARTLAGAPELLELPTDRPRPPRQDFAGAVLHIELDEALTAALKTLGQRHGTTLYMTVLAGWATVLARLSGQDDVVVGAPSSGRGSGEIEGLIGLFVNTQAVRVDVSGAPTGAELLRRVRERALEAQRHQDIPFEQVVERVRPVRSLSHTPLFQAMLAWQEMPDGDLELPGLDVGPLHGVEQGAAPFDLTLSLAPRGGRIAGTLAYATALFDRSTVQRHVGYLRRVLEEMATDDAKPVTRLDMLDAAERRRVLEEWNATHADYPRELCIHELFEAQAARTPEAVALSWRGERLTYAQLEARANQFANALRRRGVGPEVRVGICLPRTPELVSAMLGVLKAGGAYVPLDPAYPAERLGYMMEDAQVALVITDSVLADRLPENAASLLMLDAERDAIAAESADAPESGAGPENLSHVIFTSGSTGRPKGVMIRHSSTVVLLHWLRDNVTDEERSSVLFSTSINFDVSIAEVFGTLAWGGKLVIAENALELATLGEDVVYASMVPSAAAELLRSGGIPACVKTLNLGGEALPVALAQGLYALGTVEKVGNLYGPTEDTTYSTYHLVPRGAEQVLVGAPVSNTQAYVLDDHLQPVPMGAVGELYLAGDGLSRGYANRPAMTAERFVPCPFGTPGSRMYRVMDRVRWREESAEVRECVSAEVSPVINSRTDALTHSRTAVLEYLGRIDFQVKVRGYRIELGEIEARLAEHPGVRAPVVLAREDTTGDRRLVAYYLADEPVAVDALKSHLATRLPGYMVPAAYVWMQAYPQTPNGKIDRKAFPAPEADAYAAREYEAPAGDTEEAVAMIWADLLGVERVGRHDDFFQLGGNSLLATRLVFRIEREMDVELSLGDVFEKPELSLLAQHLLDAQLAQFDPDQIQELLALAGDDGDASPERGTPKSSPIVPVERDGRLALSFAQQRLWFLEQLGELGSTYHIPQHLRLRGALDRAALVRALDRIVARHEALRTTFPTVDGEPVQRIAPAEESAFRLVEHDLHATPDAKDALLGLMRDEAGAPFDLEHGPLIRGRLVRMAADDHVLLLTMHHIVSDGWSMGVLQRELAALYAAYARGESDPLPPLPVQYADYAVWHRRWVEGEVLRRQADYWRETLSGAPELLELPADHPRPARQDFAGTSLKVELDEALSAALRTLAHRHGATLHMTLMAGWAALLARLSGQDDVVVGTPSANRGRGETEGLIGFFVNTLPIRVELSGAPTAAELLGQVKARSLGAQHHQDIPFEQVVELVQPARSLAHTPLFQVMFAWENAPESPLVLPGLTLGPLDQADVEDASSRVSAKFDLSLSMWEKGGRIEGEVEYATSLFERATVERWLGCLRRVLEGMAADDAKPVDRLELLSAAERRTVVEAFNARRAEFPREAFAHERFQAQAERTPGAPALVFEDETLSYAELNARANRLAHHLRALGVGPDARVGICVERGPGMVVGMLAVLKAGGAYLPLDPAYPAERLRYMLEDGAPTALLTEPALRPLFADATVPIVELDAAAPAWASLPPTDPVRGELSPDHLAYVIYTSGSTGRPKGVRVPHGSLAATLAVAGDAFGFGAGDHAPSLASFAFDIWLFETLLPLLGGGTVRLVPRDRVPDVPRLVEDLARCTTLHAVPALMRRIVEVVRATPEGVLGTLRHAFVGGDAVPPDLLEEMRTAFPAAEIHVLYGPTEGTIICAAHRLGEEAAARQMVGRPLGNAALYVVEPGGTVAQVGVPGELCLGGASVARDYLGRPALTAERFVPDPFSAQPGARLYRTGDRVRWLADGSVEFLGRTDHQVKVRGFRIEPGEIEARLMEHTGVREAVVLVREDTPGEKRLVAYVAGDETATADVLRAHLSERLPEYMVPAAYVRLDALPLTPNGKVDRKALPAPDGDAFATRGYEAPAGAAEEAVAAIWAELLGAQRVGRHDHFFERGGHSLLAVRVVSRVRQELGVEVSPRDVFERPVLADFARGLRTAARAEAAAIERVDRTGNLPLSFAQQRLWFLEQLGNLGSTYQLTMRLRMRGDLDRGALVRSLDHIVARHEALRTTFSTVDGEAVQHIAPIEQSGFRLAEHDLGAAADAEDELHRLMQDEAGAPFDLEHVPLVRGRLVRMAADDHVLLVTMHHIVSDGWSLGVFFGELSALYAAHREGREAHLPELPVQYADYAAWQRRWVEGDVLRAQAGYWTQTLAGAPELLELPTDHPRPAKQDFAGASLNVELDEALTAALKTLGQRHGTTLYMTLLAGWAAVLARLSGQDDVVVGTPSANRGQSEIEGLIGFFVNTLPVRVDLSGAPTVAEALGRVKTRALEAQQNQDIPFEQVVELVQPARSLAHSPLFQVMFAWHNAPAGSLELPGLSLAPADAAPHVTAKFDLLLSLSEEDGRIVGEVEYATALFEKATVERWLGYLRRMLEGMAADDARGFDAISILPQAERSLVLREWNATEAAYPREGCVHELVEAQAARTPDTVAVAFEGERVTYAELNARANRLAHHLRALGVGPDARVGICVERSVEMVVGLLGILKAGGAYVPLDSSYPVERLRNMVEDSAPAVLLTHPPQAATAAALSAGSAIPVLDLTADEGWSDRSAENPDRAGVGPRNLAHVLFTSGSTGRPKGVMLEHGSLVNRLAWMQDRYDMQPHEALLQKTPFSFDVSFWEFFWPLMVGARLVMARPGGHRDPAYLVDVIRREGITVAHFVPSMLQVFLEHPGVEACTGLLRVPVSGEAVSAALVRQFHERLPGVGMYNQYGPTESGEVTEWACDPGAERVSIGRAIHNSTVYVLDRAGEPVPVGVAGELFIGGVAVARGYLGRPRLTAERFVPDPFGQPGARMYRTGDLCRWTESTDARTHSRTHALEYLGRTDFQVKVRGFRVEPGEIEARLAAHPGVRETVVLALGDGAGDKRLVAYFVGEALESEALRTHLAAQLPEYMVPAAFVRMDAFPVTPNGKLDRRALPAPDADAFAARAYEAPVGEVENALAGIWAELLGVERVGRGDSFFALGGHSLLAVRVVSRVRRALGVELAIGDLFARPVLADLARGLRAATGAEGTTIVPVERGGPLPLSFAQQRLWFVEQLGGAAAAYHVPLRLRLRGALDRDALARALDRIVARHEALRTVFALVDGEPRQRIAQAGEHGFPLLHHDLTGGADAEGELLRLVQEEAPFDLAVGPLVRGRLVRMGPEDHALLLTMHHVVSDGWSIVVLKRELAALYTAFSRGQPDPLPPLPVQYADYTAWQRRRLAGSELDAQAEYWSVALAGAPELLELPTDRPRPARQDPAGASVHIELDEALTAALRTLGRRHGTTPFMTVLAAWALVLARLSGQDDVVVGTPAAGRGSGEIEGLIGLFVNTLALRVDVSGAPTLAALLAQVRERALEAQRHQDLPFEQVVERVQPARSLSHTPVFQIMLVWQEMPGAELELPGIAAGPLDGVADGGAPFDLTLSLAPRGGRIAGTLAYATALFDQATVERYVAYLRRVLEEMAADDSTSVDRVELLGETERARVLALGEGAAPAFPRATVDALFAQAPAAAPRAVALAWDGGRMTYAELDARANRLAHHLRRAGVAAGSRVGVCLQRGPEMVVATLAVLKAGGAYVPLDPAYPAERLAFMLADTAVPVLVTESALADRLPPHAAHVVRVDADAAAIAAEPAEAPAAGTDPEAAAYVMYTSGSTGRPKGVEVPHRAIVRLVRGQDFVSIDPSDVFLQLAPASFDAATLELWGPLLNGARLALHPAGQPSVESIGRALAEHGVTILWLTAGLFHLVVEERIEILAGVRQLLAGGDVLSVPHVRRVLEELPETALINGYGPTENTTFTSCHRVTSAEESIPIGRPIANTYVRVLDAGMRPAPVGVPGELYAGGAGLALGYLNQPELTAEKFVADPYLPGARLYRTGDRVRWREVRECESAEVRKGNGDEVCEASEGSTLALSHSRTFALDFLGRVDTQVKIRGFRVEPGEIEARLAEHAGVREAVVTAREDAPGDRRLVAYYLADEPIAVDALKAHLAERLPEYMVPAAYVWMQEYPRTPNGKTDRRALPAPGSDAFAAREYEAPDGATEEAVAAIWADLLGVERVGRHDDFFLLGGNSLLATRLVFRISREMDVEISLSDVFEKSRLSALAQQILDAQLAQFDPAQIEALLALDRAADPE